MDELWSEFNDYERSTIVLRLTPEDVRALFDLCVIRDDSHSPEVHHRGMMIADRLAEEVYGVRPRPRPPS